MMEGTHSDSGIAGSTRHLFRTTPRESALHGARVLVCEDEGITQMQLARVLTRNGMLVVGAALNGARAIDVAIRERPDIVLMDINMPGMDGFEATERILRIYDPCIVMLTAYGDTFEARARQIGACGYVMKPITGDVLVERLESVYQSWIDTHNAHGRLS